MLVENSDQFEHFMNVLERSHPVFICDLETTGLRPYHGDRLVGTAFAFMEKDSFDLIESFYLPFRHTQGSLPLRLLQYLFPLYADPRRTWMNQNTKFDMHIVEQEGVRVYNQLVDLMQIAHLADENEQSYALDYITKQYLAGRGGKYEEELLAYGQEHLGCVTLKDCKSKMAHFPPKIVAGYAEVDCTLVRDAYLDRVAYIEAQGYEHFVDPVCRYGKLGREMERTGVGIDPLLCEKNLAVAEKKVVEIKTNLDSMIGYELNPGSPKQLEKLLYDELKLPVIKRNPGTEKNPQGSRSTDKEVLEELSGMVDNPIFATLMEHREWKTQISNYYTVYLRLMDGNCRIHPNLSMTGTISGRLSCKEPNLQALPRQTDRYGVRDVVVAPRGYSLISFDYSQIELRLLAYHTQDPNLLSAYQGGADIHTQTAEATGLDRNAAPGAKTLNFSAVYGIGVPGVMRKFHRSEEEANALLGAFRGQYRGIGRLRNKCTQMAKEQGYIEMWTGRRRHFNSPLAPEHKAMSNLIQGGVAEIMRIAMADKLERLLHGSRCEMILQVHDDILFQCPDEEVGFWMPIIQTAMEAFEFSVDGDPATRVPIVAEGKFGKNWGQMTKWTPAPKILDPGVVPEIDFDDLLEEASAN